MKKIKSLALCASTAFYPTLIKISKELKKLGIEPRNPKGAEIMAKQRNFDADAHKINFEKNSDYKQKAELILHHFKKIHASDGILVINETKHGINGYIGGNVLMEMGIAFHEDKPIYILNPVSEKLPHYSEVMGMLPIILDGDIQSIINPPNTIAVGTMNPVKLEAVQQAFNKVWPDKKWQVKGIDVKSDVSNQPMTDKESITGATNRAKKAIKALNTDFGVGLEGGLQQLNEYWFECGWMVVIDKAGTIGVGSSFRMQTPPGMMKMIKQGMELGEVNDIIFKKKNTKHGSGHFGLMTNDAVTRMSGYRDGLIAALARFVQPHLF